MAAKPDRAYLRTLEAPLYHHARTSRSRNRPARPRPGHDGRDLTTVTQHRPDLRFPFPDRFADRLTGRRIENVGRRAKYLVLDLDEGLVLAAHLGMTGSFRVSAGARETVPGRYYYERGGTAAPKDAPAPAESSTGSPHDHVRFVLDNGGDDHL